MNYKLFIVICIVIILSIGGGGLYLTTGAGGFERMVVRSGVYAVARPGGYEVVCFLDADSKHGGLSCLPLAAIGGEKK